MPLDLSQYHVQRRSTADEVARILRDLIFSSELSAGDALKESQLAKDLEVSRQAVREAIFMLEGEGLAERVPYKGALVKRITMESAAEIHRVRRILEPAGLDAITVEDGDQLLAACAAMEQTRSWGELLGADFTFHATLLAGLRSKRLNEYYSHLQSEMRLYFALTNRSRSYQPTDFARSHREIANALCSGRRDAARNLLIAHLETSLDDVKAALRLQGLTDEEQK